MEREHVQRKDHKWRGDKYGKKGKNTIYMEKELTWTGDIYKKKTHIKSGHI